MPLIVLTGLPCSGKTILAIMLKVYLESKSMEVEIVNEESLNIDKNVGYSGEKRRYI